jgi:hypothetical protein
MSEYLFIDAPIRQTVDDGCICNNCIRVLWFPSECEGAGFDYATTYGIITSCDGFEDYREMKKPQSETEA